MPASAAITLRQRRGSKLKKNIPIIFALLLITGCSTYRSGFENIRYFAPQESVNSGNFGYVDLYDLTLNKDKEAVSWWQYFSFSVYDQGEYKETKLVKLGGWDMWYGMGDSKDLTFRRIALLPGERELRFGEQNTPLRVPVKKNEITLVWIRTDPTRTVNTVSINSRLVFFDVEVAGSLPIPDKSRPETIGNLIRLLENKNWSVRWYAARYLAELKIKEAIEPLESLAARDALLREHAENMIKQIRKPAS